MLQIRPKLYGKDKENENNSAEIVFWEGQEGVVAVGWLGRDLALPFPFHTKTNFLLSKK